MEGEEDAFKKTQVVEARARNISHNFRCTECGSQSIEDSQANIAILLKKSEVIATILKLLVLIGMMYKNLMLSHAQLLHEEGSQLQLLPHVQLLLSQEARMVGLVRLVVRKHGKMLEAKDRNETRRNLQEGIEEQLQILLPNCSGDQTTIQMLDRMSAYCLSREKLGMELV